VAEMSPARKRVAILIVVFGSALIAERLYALSTADDDAVNTVVAPKRAKRNAASESEAERASAQPVKLRIDRLDARQLALSEAAQPLLRNKQRPLFDSVAPPVPVIKAPALAPPPKPVPPPFGYAYMGGLTEDGVRTAFFTQGERVIAVKVGDTVDAAYRIEQMTEKQMTLTYLPLNETVVLSLGGRP
jgi:hypothetical protein